MKYFYEELPSRLAAAISAASEALFASATRSSKEPSECNRSSPVEVDRPSKLAPFRFMCSRTMTAFARGATTDRGSACTTAPSTTLVCRGGRWRWSWEWVGEDKAQQVNERPIVSGLVRCPGTGPELGTGPGPGPGVNVGSAHPPTHPPVHPSVHPSVRPSTHPCTRTRPSVRPSSCHAAAAAAIYTHTVPTSTPTSPNTPSTYHTHAMAQRK